MIIDLEKIRTEYGMDLDTVLILVKVFAESLKTEFEGLQTAMYSADYEKVYYIAHKLKSGCGYFLLPQSVACFQELEICAKQNNEQCVNEVFKRCLECKLQIDTQLKQWI